MPLWQWVWHTGTPLQVDPFFRDFQAVTFDGSEWLERFPSWWLNPSETAISQIGSSPQIGMKIGHTPPKLNMEPLKRNIIFQAFIFGVPCEFSRLYWETRSASFSKTSQSSSRVYYSVPPIGHDSPNPSPIGHGEIRNNVASSKRMGSWWVSREKTTGMSVWLEVFGINKQGGILGFQEVMIWLQKRHKNPQT